MSQYFEYQNPPPSRDTQADMDRISAHFARLCTMVEADPGCMFCRGTGIDGDCAPDGSVMDVDCMCRFRVPPLTSGVSAEEKAALLAVCANGEPT